MSIAPASTRTSHRPPILARHVADRQRPLPGDRGRHAHAAPGGNAIDAGVAAGICIDVLLPDLCNFGGVAPIIVYHKASGDLVSISGLGPWGRAATARALPRARGRRDPGRRQALRRAGRAGRLADGAGALRHAVVRRGRPAGDRAVRGWLRRLPVAGAQPGPGGGADRAAGRRRRRSSCATASAPAGRGALSARSGRDVPPHDRRRGARRRRPGGRDRGGARRVLHAARSASRSPASSRPRAASSREADLADFHAEIEAPADDDLSRRRGLRLRAVVPGAGRSRRRSTSSRGTTCAALGHNSADYIHLSSPRRSTWPSPTASATTATRASSTCRWTGCCRRSTPPRAARADRPAPRLRRDAATAGATRAARSWPSGATVAAPGGRAGHLLRLRRRRGRQRLLGHAQRRRRQHADRARPGADLLRARLAVVADPRPRRRAAPAASARA